MCVSWVGEGFRLSVDVIYSYAFTLFTLFICSSVGHLEFFPVKLFESFHAKTFFSILALCCPGVSILRLVVVAWYWQYYNSVVRNKLSSFCVSDAGSFTPINFVAYHTSFRYYNDLLNTSLSRASITINVNLFS